jgi:hypothetical protein
VNTPKNKKNAPSEENKKRKRTKRKLISLNDLVPDQDVTGGHHVLFGAMTQHKIQTAPDCDENGGCSAQSPHNSMI